MSGSLRGRIFTVAVLWSLALLMAALMAATTLMLHNRWLAVRVHGIAGAHSALLLGIVAAILVFGFVQVRRAVAPLAELRWRLADVRAGRARQIDGAYPSEVQPVVDDLNALLEHQEHAVRRAVAKAGDLAHGLKTPLAIVTQEAERAEAEGRPELARVLGEQVQRMRRQVEYHLAHSRAAASGATPGASTPLQESVGGLVRTLERLYASCGVAISTSIDPAHRAAVQRQDLDEMLGNLMDNACKWAASRISVTSALDGSTLRVTIEDDGPGVPVPMRDVVLRRGMRADEGAPGSGLGLAIVRDLAELYGGSIALETAVSGGLRVVLSLPA